MPRLVSTSGPPPARRDAMVDERIDVRRYLEAIGRSVPLIAALVLVITGVVVALSLVLPKTYQATARIVFEENTSPLGQSDSESIQRRLSTTEQLLTAPKVLDSAAKKLGDASGGSLGGGVSSSVDEEANIINVVGTAEEPERAALVANAVANSFLAERTSLDRSRIAGAREALQAQIDQLSSRPGTEGQVAAIRDRISELSVSEGSAGSDLQIAEQADAPSAPRSPRPLRNGLLALFGSLFLAILLALARDQLVPKMGGSRELSRVLELPVLVGVPYVRRGLRARKARILSGVEEEAYGTLRATLEFSHAEADARVVLMTGALHGEGKTTACARLGRALARAGHKTLAISADMRVPKLHEQFGLDLGVGLSDLLSVLDWEGDSAIDPDLLERATNVVVTTPKGKRKEGYLHVITGGTRARDPGQLVSSEAMRTFLEEVRGMDYDYVLVDAPPLLGLPDAQVIAQWVDALLIVSRLDRITLEHAGELRGVLDRLDTRLLGLVVIGVTGEISPYYLTKPRTAVREPEARA